MRATAAILLLFTVVPVTAAPTEFDLSHYQAQTTLSIGSYGEPASALVELLEPFLIKNRILPERPHYVSEDGVLVATYVRAGLGDVVVEKAEFNCLSITYYSWLMRFVPPTLEDFKAPSHAAEFRADVLRFLRSLPSPRTKITDVEPGHANNCAHEF